MTAISLPLLTVSSPGALRRTAAGPALHRILPMNEAELLASVRAGDESAWRSLIERYEGCVAAKRTRMLGSGDEADDVGQETFIRFYCSLDSFRGEASLKTWLQRIATNLSLNALKRRQRGLRRFLDMDDADESAP